MVVAFHLMWGSVLLPCASGGLFVVLADVHNLPLGALSDQVSAHARNIFKTVTWGKNKWIKIESGKQASNVELFRLTAILEVQLKHWEHLKKTCKASEQLVLNLFTQRSADR